MRSLAFLLAALVAGPALATTVTLQLPGSQPPEESRVVYRCGERDIAATYINTPDNQFAVLDLDGQALVAVAVMSGSGARYVGQHYEWWTKGDGATFTDLMQDSQMPVQCTAGK